MISAEPNELMFANDSKDLYQKKLEKRQQETKIQSHSHKDTFITKLEQRQQELDEKLKSIHDSFKEDIETEMEKIRQQATKIDNTVAETGKLKDAQNSFLLDGEKIDLNIEKKEDQLKENLGNSDKVVEGLRHRVLFLESTLNEKDETIRKMTQQMKDAGLVF